MLCDEAPLAELDPEGSAAGFFAAVPLGGLVELTRSPTTSDAAARAAEGFFASLGRHVEWVGDAPGLVLGRIVCQLVNEACFALGEGVGAAEDIDAGMVLGLNHPRGPLEWGDALGAATRARRPRRALRGVPRGALPRRPRAAARGAERRPLRPDVG